MMRETVTTTTRTSLKRWAPPPRISISEWANKYRKLSPLESARPGQFWTGLTPYLDGILAAVDDPTVAEVVCQKSAQVAWTSGVVGNALGKWIDIDPTPIICLFPKEGAAKEYVAEKFEPMVTATPRLSEKIDLRSRKAQQRNLFKRFPGGFLKFVGSNSPASVKSTPCPRVVVEEPDDCNANLKNQGDSIKLAKERTKTYLRPKIIIGGTPTIEEVSAVAAEMEISDKRYFFVPCHECGEAAPLSFENLRCPESPEQNHAIYGRYVPENTFYVCSHCGVVWDDEQKNRNVAKGYWQATAPFAGVAGFYLNELYSPFPGSRFALLMQKWLIAQANAALGDFSALITFTNSSMGLPFAYKSDAPDSGSLQSRAEDYKEKTVPYGGLILTAGVDIQHDRIAIVIVAWGRAEESWRVWWGEIPGNPLDKADPVWKALDNILFSSYPHESGAQLRIARASVDSSDGVTSDAVYTYVRARIARGVMAVKGASMDSIDREIFSLPKQSIDANAKNTKAYKYGLRPYIVGTHKAKDLIDARLKLTGNGPARMHWFKDIRPDYFEQITNEVKVPHPKRRNVKVWQKKAGKPVEALDCEVYALHAARAAKVHLMNEAAWKALESKLLQKNLFEEELPAIKPEQETLTGLTVDPQKTAQKRPRRFGRNYAQNW